MAAESLARWAEDSLSLLPAPDVLLTDLSPTQIRECARAYADLASTTASLKLRGGRPLRVTYGPTGAAKALFALRPHVIPPWDSHIREELNYSGDLGSFRVYLTRIADRLWALAREAGLRVSDLPQRVGRPDSSPPKLIDEYHWIVITRGIVPPEGL